MVGVAEELRVGVADEDVLPAGEKVFGGGDELWDKHGRCGCTSDGDI